MARNGKKKYTPDAFKKKANEYFKKADKEDKPLTVTGLCLHLMVTRQTLLNYAEIDEYKEVVGLAKLRIEAYLEEKLFGKNVTGVIFNLKNNFGWKDKNETEITGKGGAPLVPVLNVTTSRNRR